MKGRELTFLSKRFLKSQGALFYIEVIAIFIVFFITTVVLSLMNGLQEKQFESIKNVASFPLIVKNVQKTDYDTLLNLTECKNGDIRIYPYKDYKMLSKNSASIAILRVANASYYQDEIFKKYFFYFPFSSLKKGRIISPYGILKNRDTYYYIDNGESGSAIIRELNLNTEDSYALNSSLYESILYKEESDFFENNHSFNVGVLGDDKSVATFSKKLKGIYKLSSYKEDMSDVYSALSIENAMLFLVMLFLLLIVFLSFQKSIKNLIFKRRSEVVVLRAFGKTRSDIFALFLLSYTVPLFTAEVFAVFVSFVLIKTNSLQRLLGPFASAINGMGNLSFVFDLKEITYMVFISFLIYLILVVFAVNSVSKVSICEVNEE